MDRIAPEIAAFYNEGTEADRLSKGLGRLEFARLTELMLRFFPTPPAVVGDIGGGPGAYALWLADQGYSVHLIDPVPLHMERALAASARQPTHALESARIGDARALPFDGETLDAVLVHGPLYHLTDRADRIRALSEGCRVLKPGGVLAVVAISRYASTVVGVVNGWIADAVYLDMVRTEIATGQHRRPEGWRVFTTAYFHHPGELMEEMTEAGLHADAVIGIQGPGWLARDFDAIAPDSPQWTALMETARLVEHEPALSPHMLGVAHRR